jgi:hypothetical protein
MTAYLTVAAVRIQSWLIRTPRLALLRGASAALTRQTARETLAKELPAIDLDSDAGDVDGVVVAKVPADQPVHAVARTLTDHLGSNLPGVEWEAWWTEADNYVDACLQHDDGVHGGSFTVLPHLLDGTLATSCPGCRREPAGEKAVELPDGKWQQFGPDCQVRWDHRFDVAGGPRLPGRQPQDFAELAREGGRAATADKSGAVGRRQSRNHLATIAADGNKIGELFRAINHGGDPGLRKHAVTELDEATKTATYEALRSLADASKVASGIRHYVGGDDVLVSVPASLAWTFCGHLGTAFERRVRGRLIEAASNTELPKAVERVLSQASLGIGVVFAHYSHPFADTQSLAFAAMKQAKKLTRGESCAVSWLDLTVENATPERRAIPLAELTVDLGLTQPDNGVSAERSRRWQALVGLTPSARAVLSDLLRDWDGRADDQVLNETSAAVFTWARRTDNEKVLQHEQAPGGGSTPIRLADLTAADRLDMLVEIRDGLSRVRWWPEPPSVSEPVPAHSAVGGRS